ncbi:MAG: deoxyribonuclease IV [Smithellaceae bacterium]
MTRLGFHISISEGFVAAAEKARRLGCRTMQIFTRNPRGWAPPRAIDPDEAAIFRSTLADYGIDPLVVHMPYLPNLASPDDTLYERSVAMLRDELERAGQLGAEFLVLHVGHRGSFSEEEAFSRVAAAINRVGGNTAGKPLLLLENTAGQGTEVGSRFPHLARIMDMIENQDRIGICFDTAHAWGAGYDLATAAGIADTLAEFEVYLGWERLRLIHLNDAKATCGAGVDRHDHIGQGLIGRKSFRLLLNHPRLSTLPFIMETPKKSEEDDRKNLRVVKRLLRKTA